MRLRELFGLGAQERPKAFHGQFDSEGLNLVLNRTTFEHCAVGDAHPWLLLQYASLQSLLEQEEATRLPNGYLLSHERAAALTMEERDLFELPPAFPGAYRLEVSGQTQRPDFVVRLVLVKDGDHIQLRHVTRRGALLCLTPDECYLLSGAELSAFEAIEHHRSLVQAGQAEEHHHLTLIESLQQAKRGGMAIDLAHFDDLEITKPQQVGVAVTIEAGGGLVLTPTIQGTSASDVANRVGAAAKQLEGKAGGSLRVRHTIVLLEGRALDGTMEVLTSPRIPASQREAFLKSPGAYLDASLVDLDLGFSVRVRGATRFVYVPLGETDASETDWFGQDALEQMSVPASAILRHVRSEADLAAFEEAVRAGRAAGASEVVWNGTLFDIADSEAVYAALQQVKLRVEEGIPETEHAEPAEQEKEERATVDIEQAPIHTLSDTLTVYNGAIDWGRYKRVPFPHQEEGVRWLYTLLNHTVPDAERRGGDVQGALLADDMGLGKTYVSLVAMDQYYQLAAQQERPLKPMLIVAPLSLLENWVEEGRKTYEQWPFLEPPIILQGGADLPAFRVKGNGPETQQHLGQRQVLGEQDIRYALKVGHAFGPERLDQNRRLVLTTYQTLRNYQFSLCRIDWGMVIFDEAQNIKNPNALQTRAAKGLKADFKLLATGTPVENSLADFWCLMDTAQPGLVGDWSTFRERYVLPINDAGQDYEERVRVGRKLRADVGLFMLRRLKEDQLDGLPKKHVHVGLEASGEGRMYNPVLAEVMTGEQLAAYDTVVASYRALLDQEDGRGKALGALQQLRRLSLFPRPNLDPSLVGRKPKEARALASLSAKIRAMLQILDAVERKSEKAIIFLMDKTIQTLLKLWLERIYDVRVHVINGDIKATGDHTKGRPTRQGLLDDFEGRPGFGVIIMSPIAAGVGLTVVGANHVIHLERHWNPAKEAQATDRVYRIGQRRDVHIHLPIAAHPRYDAFDVNLDRLLQRKTDLKDAVMTPQAVSTAELEVSLAG